MALSEIAVTDSGTRIQNFLDRAGLSDFPWKTATVLYTISWGWMLIVHDSYWSDDWEIFTEYAKPSDDLLGLAPWYQFVVALGRVLGTDLSRIFILSSFFLGGLFLSGILRKCTFLDQKQRQFIVLVFLVLPFNTARVSLMVLHYSLSYLIFFLAWYLLVNFATRKIFLFSVILFFSSFLMHSLLVFYFLPVLHKFLLSKAWSVKAILLFVRKNLIVLTLPFIYWVMRSVFWPEKVKYHDVSFSGLFKTINFVLVFGSLLLLVFILQLKLVAIKRSLQIVFAGLLCLFFGIIAYVVLGFFPPNWSFILKYFVGFLGRSDFYSRHQTLQPLGLALLIVGVVGLLPKFFQKFTRQVQVLILAICSMINVGFGFEYITDYAKQNKVVSELKNISEENSRINFQFVDQTTLLNARGRAYRRRDWQGLIWLANGVDSMQLSRVATSCELFARPRRAAQGVKLVLIKGPETHWQALKNWVSDGDMGFKVTVDDTPGACKPEMVTSERVSGAIPILFYFTGVKD